MKKVLVGLLLLSPCSYGQTKPAYEIIADETTTPSPEIVKTAEVSGAKHDYISQKDAKEINYRVSYKDVDGQPPCKVYVLYTESKTKKIGQSVKTPGICEDIIERVMKKLEAEGMTCGEIKTI